MNTSPYAAICAEIGILNLLEMRPFTYMYACVVCSLSSHFPSFLPLRQPRAQRWAGFSLFFPSNYHAKANIFLSNLGVMLFQVRVMNKLVQTLHMSKLMQERGGLMSCQGLRGEEQHQVSQQRCGV